MLKKTLLASAVATVAFAGAAQARDYISIVGSSTVYPFASAVVEQFAKNTGNKTPVIESTGSGGGLKLFCAGIGEEHPDITNASRKIKDSEIEMCAKNGVAEITEVVIGYDGIVLANAKDAPQYELSTAQIWQALAKTVPNENGELVDNPYQNWSEISADLPDTGIEVYGPPPTSGTRDAFVELVMEEGCEAFEPVKALDEDKMEAVCKTMREDGAFIEAGENDNLIVQKLDANEGALGIFGFSFLDQNRDKIQGSKINGVAPTFDNIADGAYPVARSLYFYVKNAHVGSIPGIKEYVAEFTNDKAWGPDGYLADKGLIPLPEPKREEMAKQAQSLTPMSAN